MSMTWLEILAISLVPGSIRISREFGKFDCQIVPAIFLLADYLTKKARELLTSSEKPAATPAIETPTK